VNILFRDATQSFREPRRDSNLGSSEPESDALTTRPLRLSIRLSSKQAMQPVALRSEIGFTGK
jgi:hypothetical protein